MKVEEIIEMEIDDVKIKRENDESSLQDPNHTSTVECESPVQPCIENSAPPDKSSFEYQQAAVEARAQNSAAVGKIPTMGDLMKKTKGM